MMSGGLRPPDEPSKPWTSLPQMPQSADAYQDVVWADIGLGEVDDFELLVFRE
jgi:hypothetical protein